MPDIKETPVANVQQDINKVQNVDLAQKIINAIGNLVVLNIETTIEGDDKKRQMKTVIDLVQGDIKNSVHQDFLSGELSALREFHESQVEKGQQIIKDNIAAVKAIYELIKDNGLDAKKRT